MMTFGARAHDYGKASPQVLFGRIARDGWDCVQLAFKKCIDGVTDYHDITPALTESTRLALEEAHLAVGVLGVYVNPGHMDEQKRAASVAEFNACIPRAAALHAGCIGTETTKMCDQPAGTTRPEALRQLYKSLEEILPVAQQHGVIVGIEPVFYHTMASSAITKQVLHDMASPNLKVIFDPVNLFEPKDEKTQRILWATVLEDFGTEICAVHMKGIRVQEGELQSCGFADSCIDYRYLFDRLRQLPQPLPVFREEVKPEHAVQDLQFLKKMAEA